VVSSSLPVVSHLKDSADPHPDTVFNHATGQELYIVLRRSGALGSPSESASCCNFETRMAPAIRTVAANGRKEVFRTPGSLMENGPDPAPNRAQLVLDKGQCQRDQPRGFSRAVHLCIPQARAFHGAYTFPAGGLVVAKTLTLGPGDMADDDSRPSDHDPAVR
jgi:hypothetical protein